MTNVIRLRHDPEFKRVPSNQKVTGINRELIEAMFPGWNSDAY